MAAAASSSAGDMQVHVLDLKDLASADIYSWRLRAAPHLNADEVGVFHHGDKINAWGDSSEHCQWLRLTDGTGWVKKCHEGNPVWQTEQKSCAKACSPSPATMSCIKKDVETKFASPSSESQSIQQGGHGLRDLMPLPFAGEGHRLGGQCQWFTGTRCKLGPDESQEKVTEKQLWADVEDSQDFDSGSTVASLPRSSKVLTSFRERWADMEDTDDEEDVGISGGDPRMESGWTSQISKDAAENHLSPDCEVSTQASTQVEQQALRNPRRKKRTGASINASATSLPIGLDNQQEEEADSVPEEGVRKPRQRARNLALLKKKNKTQFCRYLQDTGCCPFEGKCWFAHDLQEMQT